MALIYWWVALLGLVALAIAGRLRLKKLAQRSPSTDQTVRRVAHSQRLRNLPEYQALQQRYRRLLLALFASMLGAICLALIMGSRPSTERLVTPEQTNRDIMLCLDVSGSMTAFDAKIIEQYELLARQFSGQRIGLDIFDAAGAQVFPLTNDYDLVLEELAKAKKALGDGSADSISDVPDSYFSFVAGTRPRSSSAPNSNVGVGLTGCIKHLGENPTKRSQSIILATDNRVFGSDEDRLITTIQAMAYAKKLSIRVYSLDPSRLQSNFNGAQSLSKESAELRTGSQVTGGAYYNLEQNNSIPDIIEKISAQEATLFVGDSQYSYSDAPRWWFVVLTGTIGAAAVLHWRLKL
ncbi:hypothetical protein CSA80_02625 [Candidatus Saccharibacteria bacterium]|nr:MAG: hypothetical protein CR973_02740 [Candidatus Saccharibacteria bacterium]PID98991.1 MAG: hypothetical protein CSA80_02625 [Candidatus Saccharibacteria bacterium]